MRLGPLAEMLAAFFAFCGGRECQRRSIQLRVNLSTVRIPADQIPGYVVHRLSSYAYLSVVAALAASVLRSDRSKIFWRRTDFTIGWQ